MSKIIRALLILVSLAVILFAARRKRECGLRRARQFRL